MLTFQNLPNQGERLARLRSYAQDAARSIHNYALPEGAVNEILAKMNLSASLETQISMAQSMATLIAETATTKLRNDSAAPDGPGTQLASLGLPRGMGGWMGNPLLVGGGGGNGSGSSERSSSASYDGMSGKMGDWTSPAGQAYMREYAVSQGLSWAANNPDLLKLGPTAINALRDVKLQQESFDRFKKIGLDEKTIVAGAGYSKRNNVDMNETSRNLDEVNRGIKAGDQPVLRDAVRDLYKCPPGQDAACQAEMGRKLDLLRQNNPHMVEPIERLRTNLHAAKRDELVSAANRNNQVGQDQADNSAFNNMFAAAPSAQPQSPAPNAPQKPEVPNAAPKSPAPSAAPKSPAASAERPAAAAGKSASAAPAPH